MFFKQMHIKHVRNRKTYIDTQIANTSHTGKYVFIQKIENKFYKLYFNGNVNEFMVNVLQ